MSPRESPRESLDSTKETPRPRDDCMSLFLLSTTVVAAVVATIAATTAALYETFTLTRYANELKRSLFILICQVTFLAGPT
jgi:hypothetical protein